MPDQDTSQAPSYQDVANSGADYQSSNLAQVMNTPEPQPTLAPQSAPAPTAPAPPDMNSVLNSGGPQQPPSVLTQPPPTELPRFKRTVGSILKGALLGLALDGVPGMVAGGVSPTAVQGAAQRIKTFADAQAANAVADAGIRDQQLHALPQQIQDDHNASAAQTMKNYAGVFGPPDYVINNHGDDAMNAIKNIQAQQGAVPHLLIVNTGDQLVAWNTDKIAAADNTVQLLNKAGKAGNPILRGMTQSQWDALPKQQQGTYIEQMNGVLGTVVPSHDAREQQAQIATLNQQIATVKALPDTDPDRAGMLTHLNSNLKLVQGASDAADQRQQTMDQSKVDYKQAQEDARKYGYAFDPKTNEAFYVSKADADKQGLANFEPQTPATIKADLHDQRVLNDVALKSNLVRQAASKLPPGGTVGIALAKELADNPNTTANSFAKEKAYSILSPAEKDYAIKVLSLRESSMGLQKVLTGTARNNETQLQALLNTLPGLEPDATSVGAKLDQFNQNMELLRAGVPKALPGITQVPLQTSAPASAPATSKIPGLVIH